jgi:uncharacterized protein (TIGR02996 family)
VNDADAFLAAIIAQPDDDNVRLVFADWLEEHGDRARAEFIRLQIREVQLHPASPERKDVSDRVRSLFEQHSKEWLADLSGHPAYIDDFERGFLTRLRGLPAWIVKIPDRAWERHPIHKLTLRHFQGQLDRALAVPHLARIRVFDLSCPREAEGMTDADAEALATCPYLTGVRSFTSHGAHGNALVEALARCPSLSGLTSLWLLDKRIDDEGMEALAGTDKLSHLTELWLSLPETRAGAARALARTPTALERLSIESGLIGDWGVEALAQSPHLAGLREVRLLDQQIGPAGARALAQSRHLTSLRALDLCGNPIGPTGARALATALWPELGELRLNDCKLGTAGAEALAGSARWTALTELTLQFNEIGPAGAVALSRSERLRGLTALDLWGNPIGNEGARALCESKGALKTLSVGGRDTAFAPTVLAALKQRFGTVD